MSYPQQRRVRIVAGLNETTGNSVFYTAEGAALDPSELEHFALPAVASLFDKAFMEKPTLETVRKRGASAAGVSIDELTRERGGDPSYRIPKTGGFFLSSTAEEIRKERKKREAREARQTIVYQAHP